MVDTQAATIQELLESHRQLIEAEHQRIEVEKERLKEVRKAATAEQRRAVMVEELLSSVGLLTQRVDALIRVITALLAQWPLSESITELTDEVRNGIGRIEDKFQLVLEVNRFVLPYVPDKNGTKARLMEQINDAMNQPRIDSLKRQLLQLQRTLNSQRERAANYGLDTPTSLLNEIEQTEARITETQKELDVCCE